jgi:periodic tryptophan protein 2
LCYSADGSYILAGGSSKYICMYDVADQVCFILMYNLMLIISHFNLVNVSNSLFI